MIPACAFFLLLTASLFSTSAGQNCSPRNSDNYQQNGCSPDAPCCSSAGFCGYSEAYCGRGNGRAIPQQYLPKGFGELCYAGDLCERGLSCKYDGNSRYCL